MKYTAEKVRDYADACRLAHKGPVIADMLTELAERIKADEGAAQVDQVGELLAIIHGDGGHYQAEHGLQKAAKDAQEKVIQMMTKIATAEPVAHGESAWLERLKDPATVHALMLRGVIAIPSIRSMVDLRGEVPNGEDVQLLRIAELQEQLAAQPAQSVDVEKVREVISYLKRGHRFDVEMADKLTAALQESGNG